MAATAVMVAEGGVDAQRLGSGRSTWRLQREGLGPGSVPRDGGARWRSGPQLDCGELRSERTETGMGRDLSRREGSDLAARLGGPGDRRAEIHRGRRTGGC